MRSDALSCSVVRYKTCRCSIVFVTVLNTQELEVRNGQGATRPSSSKCTRHAAQKSWRQLAATTQPTRPAHHGSCFGKTGNTPRSIVCGSTRHTHSHRQSLWSVGLKQGGRRYPRRPQLSPRYTCTRLPQGLLIRQISSRCRPRLPAKSLFRCREPRDRPRRGAPPLCNHGTCKNP